MFKRIVPTSKGMTLVELLATLAVFSVVSVIIIGYLVGGLKNFKKVNEEIALHDEANYVMSQFVNYIFVASKVNEVPVTECDSCIEVIDLHGNPTKLGFHEDRAVINGEPINHSNFKFSNETLDSLITKHPQKDAVIIKIIIKNGQLEDGKSLELNSEVAFVKVD